jgi:hypothetical protein
LPDLATGGRILPQGAIPYCHGLGSRENDIDRWIIDGREFVLRYGALHHRKARYAGLGATIVGMGGDRFPDTRRSLRPWLCQTIADTTILEL